MFKSLSFLVLMIAAAAPTSIACAQSKPLFHLGQGCTTTFFIDKDCDGYGVGVKSSGLYPISQGAGVGTAAWYTTGDMPDADDEDPNVNTTASWEAKWGTDVAGMARFLRIRKDFTNIDRIFYVAQSGSDATGVISDPTHPYRSMAPILNILKDMQGGAVIIRGGNWTDLDFNPCPYRHGNPCWNISGTADHPVYVMNYPGELVKTNIPLTSVTYAPFPNVGYVTFDGLVVFAEKYGAGDGVATTSTTNMTYVNMEFAGWHQIGFSNNTRNVKVIGNVFHDMMFHTVYFMFCCGMQPNRQGDFDFNLDAQNHAAGTSQGASYNGHIIGNVMYGNGAGGYEPIHVNTFTTGVVVEGNIVSFGGGSPVSFQTGVYNSKIVNNVFFDNGRDGVTLYLYDHGRPNFAATIRNIEIENNTIYVGKSTDWVRGTNPAGGIAARDSTTSGDFQHWIKDVTVRNNVIVTDDWNAEYAGWPFNFGRNSFPSSWTIENNDFWSNSTTPVNTVATVQSTAFPDGHAAGTYNLAKFQAAFPKAVNNIWADPKLRNVSQTYTMTPAAYDLRPVCGSPVINAGSKTNAPATDIRRAARDAFPDIGAYEVRLACGP